MCPELADRAKRGTDLSSRTQVNGQQVLGPNPEASRRSPKARSGSYLSRSTVGQKARAPGVNSKLMPDRSAASALSGSFGCGPQ